MIQGKYQKLLQLNCTIQLKMTDLSISTQYYFFIILPVPARVKQTAKYYTTGIIKWI